MLWVTADNSKGDFAVFGSLGLNWPLRPKQASNLHEYHYRCRATSKDCVIRAIGCRQTQATGVYVIMSGEVGIFINEDASGDPVAVLSTSDVVGEMGVIANQPRSATLRAQGEVRCLRILADDFMDLMRDNPEVSLSVLRQIVDRLTRTTQALEALKRE